MPFLEVRILMMLQLQSNNYIINKIENPIRPTTKPFAESPNVQEWEREGERTGPKHISPTSLPLLSQFSMGVIIYKVQRRFSLWTSKFCDQFNGAKCQLFLIINVKDVVFNRYPCFFLCMQHIYGPKWLDLYY